MSIATTASQPPDEQTASSTNADSSLRRIEKGRRLTGESAKQFTVDVIKAYETRSIRSICTETGRSYGAIHRLLTTNGVTMRPKGYQRKTSTSPADAS
ncbi:helix-turn-helix domain-containing protein [Streptomyces sp. NPDC057837]|uniref:helix-turn-helix domain-containing protein n=1 Tax=Streptomyces sp. NPDC057837 TaxID=3346260 RepID=UPI003687FEF9